VFTFDHLTRFTPATARALFALAGLEVRAESVLSTRVPMWFLLAPTAPKPLSERERLVEDSRQWLAASRQFIEQTFAAFDRCVVDAAATGGRIAIYGLGA